MRVILFRGKRTDNGEWAYGVPTKDNHGEMVMVESTFECEEYICCGANCLYVDENTVGQYTCLTDKNGTKIFEGDIVTYVDAVADYEGYHDGVFLNCGSVEISEWDGICFTNRQIVEMDDLYESETTVCCEVIGNIHDNPEKLKIGATAKSTRR